MIATDRHSNVLGRHPIIARNPIAVRSPSDYHPIAIRSPSDRHPIAIRHPAETEWKLRVDGSLAVIASGGPYSGSPALHETSIDLQRGRSGGEAQSSHYASSTLDSFSLLTPRLPL